MIAGVALLLFGAASLRAQAVPGAVLAQHEPHHHLAYADSTLRVLRVRVPPHDTTLLHEHDPDYFWVALGTSTVVSAIPGKPDATISSNDLSIHYSVGPFAHVARNPAGEPFDNITVELLGSQKNVRNLCEVAVAGKPLECSTTPSRSGSLFSGAAEHPAFATDRLRVSLLTLAPGRTLRPSTHSRTIWMIALDTADVGRGLALDGGGQWHGGTFRASPGMAWALRNRGSSSVRVVAVVDAARRGP